MKLTFTHEGTLYAGFTAEEAVAAGVPDAAAEDVLNHTVIAQSDAQIDAICDRVFTASPSRVKRYDEKYQEALAFRDAGYPAEGAAEDWPYLLGGEAEARGITPQTHADAIIAMAESFNALGAEAEAMRAEAQFAILAAEGAEAKVTAYQALAATFAARAQAAASG